MQQALNGWLERVGGVDAFAKRHSLDVSAIERVAQSDDTNMPVILVDQVLQAMVPQVMVLQAMVLQVMGLKLTYELHTVEIGIMEAFVIENLDIMKISEMKKRQPMRFQLP